MVSKLMLAVAELIEKELDENIRMALIREYREIRASLGYKREAKDYGSFPFMPYSHTPKGKGAKQPGMTGQVKEEVITRNIELGAKVEYVWHTQDFLPKGTDLVVVAGGFSYGDYLRSGAIAMPSSAVRRQTAYTDRLPIRTTTRTILRSPHCKKRKAISLPRAACLPEHFGKAYCANIEYLGGY